MSSTAPASDRRPGSTTDRGYIMVVLLVAMAVGAIWMSALLPAWRQQVQRQREEDLIFIGEQYAKSIVLYQMKNQGAYPPNVEALVSGNYLRKQWKDPITGEDFMVVGQGISPQGGQQPGRSTAPPPTGPQTPGRGGAPGASQPGSQQMVAGISGVRSRSTATSIKIYKNLQQHSLWPFDAQQFYMYMNYQPGRTGGPGRGGQPNQPGQPGRGGPGGPVQGGPGRGGDGRGGPATPLPPARGGRGGI